MRIPPQHVDVLIVGSGLAGLTAALELAPTHRVAVVTKCGIGDSASSWAQGGIAAVMAEQDSYAAHVNDTQVAGAGLCDPDASYFTVENAPAAIQWLCDLGVPFSMENGALHLTREGGHSHRRIVHATDATGAAIQRTLSQRAQPHPNITFFEHHMLVDLMTHPGAPLRCQGAYLLNVLCGTVQTFSATHTVLATGGAGKVYRHTTNPDTATGDGIAAAWRAGCQIGNMEFIQFHPTCLYHPEVKNFLISEALRGEGGMLKLPAHLGGHRFMPDHDFRAELAPRDVVARAIDFEMKKHGIDHVNLDISHKSPAFIQSHFPTIMARCAELGIDITQAPIPVVPAAHYVCGGVVTDLQGRTQIQGLYAIGEATCTGLHGANRLASNSLLECIVFAQSATRSIQAEPRVNRMPVPEWPHHNAIHADTPLALTQQMDELRRLMWDDVGIVRSDERLARAAQRIQQLQQDMPALAAQKTITREWLEWRNLVQVAELIVTSAQMRCESRGLHFNRDYPKQLPQARPTVLQPVSCVTC